MNDFSPSGMNRIVHNCLFEVSIEKVPLVCSNITSFQDFRNFGVSFFEIENINSLKKAVNNALKNKLEYSEIVYQEYKKKYTAKIMSDNYLDLYKNLLDRNDK